MAKINVAELETWETWIESGELPENVAGALWESHDTLWYLVGKNCLNKVKIAMNDQGDMLLRLPVENLSDSDLWKLAAEWSNYGVRPLNWAVGLDSERMLELSRNPAKSYRQMRDAGLMVVYITMGWNEGDRQ